MPLPTWTGAKIGVDWNNRPVLFGRHPILDEVVRFNGPIAANLVDQVIFVCPPDQSYQVVGATEIHGTAGSDGSAVTLQLTKDTGTQAPGAGTDLLTAGFNLKGTANTVQQGALVTTTATVTLGEGDRLSIDFAGTLTALTLVHVTVLLKRIT